MRGSRLGSWIALLLGTLYFVVPLIATFEFSLRMRRGVYSFDAYQVVFSDPRFFPQSFDITTFHDATFLYSTVAALATIVLGVLLVPTAYWIQVRLPASRSIVEFTPLPAGRPGNRHRLGYLRLYNSSAILPLTASVWTTDLLLVFGYVTLALPYMYRSVDGELRAIDVHPHRSGAES
jgi:putative spermidine/putrescine transport system permease protein